MAAGLTGRSATFHAPFSRSGDDTLTFREGSAEL